MPLTCQELIIFNQDSHTKYMYFLKIKSKITFLIFIYLVSNAMNGTFFFLNGKLSLWSNEHLFPQQTKKKTIINLVLFPFLLSTKEVVILFKHMLTILSPVNE